MAWNIEGFDALTFKEFARRLREQLKTATPAFDIEGDRTSTPPPA